MSGRFNFGNITLASGGGRKGVKYTGAEKALALQILSICAAGMGRIDEGDLNVDDDVVEAVTTAHADVANTTPNEVPLGAVARKAFGTVSTARLETDPDGFPKKRDYISVNLIFRKAASKLPAFTQEEVDILFRSPSSYGQGKNKKAS